jgi:hypothetical protein
MSVSAGDGRIGITAAAWLRRVHGWVGLWGAALGLLFGASGLALDHHLGARGAAGPGAGAAAQARELQLALPAAAPDSPQALGQWLQGQLRLQREPTRVRRERAQAVVWDAQTVQQPAHWIISFATPRENVQADWWQGNRFVSVHRASNSPLQMLESLHRGTGLGMPWVLLADSLGGAMMLLAISGVLLWMLAHRRRRVGALIALGSLALMLALLWRGIS